MPRCNNRTELEVHHIRRDGGNGIDNAQVLCQQCHENTSSYGAHGDSPEPFSDITRVRAKRNAGFRCQCEQDDCGFH